MELFEQLSEKIKGQGKRIVFPEGTDERVLGAAVRLADKALIEVTVLGDKSTIEEVAAAKNYDLQTIKILDPEDCDENLMNLMIEELVKRRNGKTDEVTAEKWLKDENYFGTMLVYLDLADGMVSGATHPTGDTVRPALQIVKTKPGSSRISGAFVMQRGEERYVFADCAINIDLDAQTMAEVAVQSAETAQVFGIDPKVAMLSFSTKGSAKAPQVDKVAEATEIAHKLAPDLAVDGELQFDAAFVESVAASKAPDSDVAGQANVFVFPDLQSGNITSLLCETQKENSIKNIISDIWGKNKQTTKNKNKTTTTKKHLCQSNFSM